MKKNGDSEPFVDPSQDYILLLGYENATHTVMRFKRKLDTCDTSHDIPITVSTTTTAIQSTLCYCPFASTFIFIHIYISDDCGDIPIRSMCRTHFAYRTDYIRASFRATV